MSQLGHGDIKYKSQRLSELAALPDVHIERRRISKGTQSALTLECTEVVMTVAGRSVVRRTGNGDRQETLAQPGTTWICPVGIHERDIELSEPLECLHIYLPPTLIQHSALADFDIDPSKIELAYVGGFTDLRLHHIGAALLNLVEHPLHPADRLFGEGMRTALVACLLRHYTIDRGQFPAKEPERLHRRLKRVLELIDAHLADDLSLDALAAEACLSAFHFSRLFRKATGLSPYLYVTHRRVEVARRMLASDHPSLVEIALHAGFGSQGNFTRVFRKITGLTPGQYRDLHRR